MQANARGERFITLVHRPSSTCARDACTYVNAGHNDPLLLTANGITPLRDGCIALGMMPTAALPAHAARWTCRPDSTLLCYTDGLVEQEDAARQRLRHGALGTPAARLRAGRRERHQRSLIAAFEAHRGGQPYLDDIALLTCR